MNCKDWEERIALGASGDLGSAETAEVVRHLAECGGCRRFAEGIRESLELLRSAHEEPIDAGHYTAVRAAVLAQLAQPPRHSWRRWLWGAALAAGLAGATLFLATLFVARPPAEQPRGNLAEVRPPVVEPRLTEPVRQPPQRRTVRPAPVRIWKTIGPPPLVEPIVVKLVTDDPDIVIYWIADRKGAEE